MKTPLRFVAPHQFPLTVLLLALSLGLTSALAQPTSYTWNGGPGSWFDAAKWTPNGVPAAGDEAIISSGAVTLAADATVANLTINGGTLTGAANLTVTTAATWSSGGLEGGGTLTIAAGATMTVSGAGALTLNARLLDNSGTVTLAGAGALGFNGGMLVNRNGGVFDITTDQGLVDVNNGGSVTNEVGAVFRKSAGAGTSTINQSVRFWNQGTVEAQSGTLAFDTVLVNSGTLDAGGNLITYSRTQTFNNGSTLAGNHRMTAGSSAFGGAIAAESFEIAGGTVSGAFACTGSILWSGGGFAGDGTLTIPAGSTLTINSVGDLTLLNGYKLDNSGTVALAGSGSLGFHNGAVVINRNGGEFDIQNDQGFFASGQAGSFTNEAGATFVKSAGAGTSTIGNAVSFWNAGAVEVDSGVVAFDTTLVNSGTLDAGGNLITYSRTQTFNNGSTLSGINRMLGGTSAFSGAVAAENFEITAGTVSGTFTSTGTLLWLGGTFSGNGVLTIPAGSTLAINSATDRWLHNGFTVDSFGTVTLAGAGSLGFNNGVVVNRNGGLFDVQSDAGLLNAGNGGSFTNEGGAIFRKSGGVGTSAVANGVSFANDGTVEVQSGVLAFGTTLVNSGTLDAGADQLITYAGGQTFNAGSTLTGTNRMTGGTSTFSGAIALARFEFTGGTAGGAFTGTGTFVWEGGDFSGTGVFTIANGSTLMINSTTNRWLYGGYQLNNLGTVTLAGGGSLGFNGGSVVNRSGGVFNIQNDQGLLAAGNGGSVTNEAGATFRKSAGAGTSTVNNGVGFWNAGTVEAQSGVLAFDTTLVNSGTLDAGAANLITFSRTQTFLDGSTLSGTNRMIAGASSFTGMIANEFFEFTAGMVSGTFTNQGSFLWQGGNLDGPGTLTVPAGSTLTMNSGGNLVLLNGYRLENHGTITLAGSGSLGFHSGAAVNNRSGAEFDIQVDQGFYGAGSGNGSFTNHAGAVLRKTIAAGTTLISPGQFFRNDGLVQVQTGTLQFDTTLINNGTLAAGGVGLLVYTGNQTFNTGSILTGVNRITGGSSTFTGAITAPALELTGGTVSGTFTPTGAFLWQGGDLSGGGTLTVPAGSTLTINSSGNLVLNNSYLLDNSGTVTLAGSGALGFNNGRVVNRNGGVFDIQNDQGLANAGNGGSFTNEAGATFRKSAGAGTSTISDGVSFRNLGTVEVQSGALAFDTTLVNSGTLDAGAGLITFSRTQTFQDGSTLSGATRMTGGTSAFSGAIAAANFTFTAGMVSGSFTNTGNILWAGGSFAGAGTLGIAAGGTLVIDSTLAADGTTDRWLYNGFQLDNSGTVTLAGPGALGFHNGAVVNNRNGGVFDIQNDQGLFDAGNGGSFTNAAGATFVKSAGAGTSTVGNGVSIWNLGTVRAQSGVLAFDTTLVNSGTMDAGAGNLIVYTRAQTFQDGSTLTGTNRVSGGSSTVSGTITAPFFELTGGTVSGTFTAAGTFLWAGGDLSGGGTLTVPAGSTLTINSGGNLVLSGGYTLDNSGTVTLAGSGALGFNNGVVVNRGGAVFDMQNNQGLLNLGNGGSFTNAAGATFRKSAGAGTSTINNGVNFWNLGTVEVRSGVVAFTSQLVNSGTLDAGASQLITYRGGQTFLDGSMLLGTNRMTGGFAMFSGTITNEFFELTASLIEGTFTHVGHMRWAGGSLYGNGVLTVATNGTLLIDSTTAADGTTDRVLYGGYRVDNFGTVILTGPGSLGFNNNAVFNNRSGGVFDIQNDQGLINAGNSGSFTNDAGAIFRKSAGTGTSRVGSGVYFQNDGLVQVQTGTLQFDNILINNGTMDAGAAGLLLYTSRPTFNDGSTLTGTNRLAASWSWFNGGIAATRLEWISGDVFGAFTNTGAIVWQGGYLSVGGTLTIPNGSTLAITVPADQLLYSGHNVDNYGTVTLAGNGTFGFKDGATVINRSGAVFDIQNDRGLYDAGGGGSFTNAAGATFRKSAGTGTTTINIGVNFWNAGTVQAQSGVLAFDTTLVNSGTLDAGAGGLITYNRTQTFDSGSTMAGTNRMIGGTSTFNGAIAAARFEFAAGTVSGTFTNTGSIVWTEGSFSDGALSISAGSTLAINSASDRWLLNGYQLHNEGTITLAGGGRLGFLNGAVLNNRNGALFDIQSDSVSVDVSGGGSITNAAGAIFRKSGGSGTSTINHRVKFYNYGTVQVQSGALAFNTLLVNSGTLAAGAGNLILYSYLQSFQDGSILSGTHRMTDGGTTFSGSIAAERFEFTGGTVSGTFMNTGSMLWAGGNFRGPGTLTIPAGSALTMNGAGTLVLNNGYSLDNRGLATLAGSGSLGFSAGAVVNNRNGAVFDVQSNAGLIDAGNGGSFANEAGAVFRKSAGTGTTLIGDGVAFSNAGRLEIQSGIVQVARDYLPAATAVLRVAIGGLAPATQFGRLQVGHSTTLAGALEVTLANGFVPAAGNTFQVVTADGLNGTFGSVSSVGSAGGIYFVPTYQPTGVLLTAQSGQASFDTALLSTSGGQFSFTLNGEAGRTYVLEVSTNLVNWVPLATNIFAGVTWNFSEVMDPGTTGRFFRVLLITP